MSEYVGFDVSNEEALFASLREHCLCPGRIVVETGTLIG
jgi:hypothetical protein